jgi:uncharacterized protein (TIGR01777 family)
MGKRILIAGGTGLIGSAIHHEAAERGWDVTILSRRSVPGGLKWDPAKSEINLQVQVSFDAIINLAGVSIAGHRWSRQHIREVQDSRVNASLTIEKYLRMQLLSTQLYIGSSAIGIYGDKGEQLVDENTPPGNETDWMVTTGKAWEESHREIAALGIRTVILRTGMVLSTKGGALKELLRTASLGIIGYFGSGKQFWPWIHIRDLVNIVEHAIVVQTTKGLYLAVAPEPVSSKALSKTLASVMYPQRIALPVPEFFLALLLGSMRRMLLQSCRAYPSRLLNEGFTFEFPKVKEALKDLMEKKKEEKKV